MAAWHRTTLSTNPPMIEMADTDRKALAIAAGEEITDVAATVALYDDPATDLEDVIESAEVNTTDDGAVVLMSGLTRNNFYEMSIVFSRADGTTWTRTLAIRCVA